MTVREYGPDLIRNIELKPDTLGRVQRGLADVVHGPGGTGAAARSPLVRVAGKTGTAQVIEMKGAYLKSEHLSYENRDHAWFVAYGPVEDPQIAVAILVEHGGHGGDAAAPIAKKLFEKMAARQNGSPEKQEARAEGDRRAN